MTFHVGDPLPLRLGVAEMCAIFRLSSSRFHRQVKRGAFDRFELRPKIGRRTWSGRLVQNYLDALPGASRFVAVKRSA